MTSTRVRARQVASLCWMGAICITTSACFEPQTQPPLAPEREGFRLVMADAPVGAPLAGWRAPDGDVAYVVGGRILGSGTGFIWELDLAREQASVLGTAPSALWWIHGLSRTQMWVVGESGLAASFDGRSLRPFEMPATVAATDTTLYGVWSADGGEIWAVGVSRPEDGSERGLLLLSTDGARFEEVDYGFVAPGAFYKVWGSSAFDVFVVGNDGVILHFDGSSWTQQDSGTTERLGVVHGRGPNQVWAAGGASEGLLLRWDGSSWRRDESLPAFTAPLYGLWVAPEAGIIPDWLAPSSLLPKVVYVSGLFGTVGRHYEAEPWIVQDAPETSDVLHSVIGWDTSRALALGGNLLGGPPYTGVMLALSRGLDDGLPLDGDLYYRRGVAPSRPGGGGGGGFQ